MVELYAIALSPPRSYCSTLLVSFRFVPSLDSPPPPFYSSTFPFAFPTTIPNLSSTKYYHTYNCIHTFPIHFISILTFPYLPPTQFPIILHPSIPPMGNIASTGANARRRNSSRRSNPPPPPPPQPPQPEIVGNRYVFAAATPYPPSQYPNPNAPPYYQYPGYYPPPPPSMPMPLPAPYDNHHVAPHGNWANGRYPYGAMMQAPATPYVEHQKAVTIRNDVNLKKETLRIEPDEDHPGKFLVAFSFDATVTGSITIMFFAKEGEDCCLTPMKESLHPPITVQFEQGLAQKFRQPSGTGIDFSMFEEGELSKDSGLDVYPLAVKAEASPDAQSGNQDDASANSGNQDNTSTNSQITQAVFEKDKGEYKVRVVKQILWVNGMRYELQEIYGIGNSVEGEVDTSDPGKECVICLSEPRDTTVLPCRHMCMCSECAKVLRFQTNRCPICRQPVERLLEIKVSNSTEE